MAGESQAMRSPSSPVAHRNALPWGTGASRGGSCWRCGWKMAGKYEEYYRKNMVRNMVIFWGYNLGIFYGTWIVDMGKYGGLLWKNDEIMGMQLDNLIWIDLLICFGCVSSSSGHVNMEAIFPHETMDVRAIRHGQIGQKGCHVRTGPRKIGSWGTGMNWDFSSMRNSAMKPRLSDHQDFGWSWLLFETLPTSGFSSKRCFHQFS